MSNTILNRRSVLLSSGLDSDANSFIIAAGITDQTQQQAINALVVDLKTYGLWGKMKAVYPIVGGSATSHKFNLKDPRDLDAAFRLSFQGGWTHSATGALPNGTNAYANTFFDTLSNLTATSGHFGMYSRTSAASLTPFGISGNRDSVTFRGIQICIRRASGDLRFFVMFSEATGGSASAGTETDARGFYLGSRTANNNLTYYKNGNSIGTNTATHTEILTDRFVFLSGNNASGAPDGNYDNKELAFASLGYGLDASEVTNYYTAVQKFQTTLSRNV